jgi:cation:H+ antiporter
MNDHAALIIGVACAWLGGDLFVRSAVRLARWAKISPVVIGATVAGFATSAPELSVAVNSALAGHAHITFGNVLGSNVANVALILALAVSISSVRCPRQSVRRDFPLALAVPVVIALLIFDSAVSRLDAALMLVVFFGWLIALVMGERNEREPLREVKSEERGAAAIVMCLVGLAFLWGAGYLIVAGASGIAVSLGVDEFVIGATVVAVGTTMPELATTVISKLRGHEEVGLGTVLGSNVFNGFFITPVAASITPMDVDVRASAAPLVFGLLAVLLTYPTRAGLIGRGRGPMLLALYAVYLALVALQPAY